MNSSAGVIGTTADQAAQVISSWGFTVTPDMLTQMAQSVGENSILSRTGGAPTLAVGMASILSSFLGGGAMMGIWYHFIILFEALFILTTVDAGTRVLRFMIQDFVGAAIPAFRDTRSWTNNVIGSAIACVLWGYLLYAGVVDPYGGVYTMWPLFGATNQMLAAIALTLCTVILFKMKRERFALVTAVPMPVAAWSARSPRGWRRSSHSDPAVGFLSPCGEVRQRRGGRERCWRRPRRIDQMNRVVFNDYLDAALAAAAVAIVLMVVVYAIIDIRKATGFAEDHGDRDRRRGRGGRRHDRCRDINAVCACEAVADGAVDGRHSRLSDLCRASADGPPRPADHDLRGVFPRSPAGALRRRQGPVPRLLLRRV